MTKTRIILLICAAAFVIHLVWIFPQLPETVATHFDAAGDPNGWMAKTTFLIFEIGLLVFVVGEMLFVVPWMIGRLPNSMINLPNKEYWLAEGQRMETIGIFRRYFEVFGSVIVVLFLAVNHLVYLANVTRQSLSGSVWLIMIGFFFFVVIWLISLIRQFTQKK